MIALKQEGKSFPLNSDVGVLKVGGRARRGGEGERGRGGFEVCGVPQACVSAVYVHLQWRLQTSNEDLLPLKSELRGGDGGRGGGRGGDGGRGGGRGGDGGRGGGRDGDGGRGGGGKKANMMETCDGGLCTFACAYE